MPGKAAHFLAWILTLMLMLLLTGMCLTWQVNRVLTDAPAHESVAADPRVRKAQMERIEAQVQELAQQYAFQPETVMALVTEESIARYNRDVIAWWTGLLGSEPVMNAPAWPTREVEQAVREDEAFKAATPAETRRTVARDKVAYQVGQIVKKTVLPVRADILSALLPQVLRRIDVPTYMHYLSLTPLLCGVAAAICALLLLLVMIRRLSKGALYIGAALGASGLCVLGILTAFSLLGISGMTAELSGLLALQMDILMEKVFHQAGMYAAAALAAGVGLIALHQADIRRLAGSRRRSAA